MAELRAIKLGPELLEGDLTWRRRTRAKTWEAVARGSRGPGKPWPGKAWDLESLGPEELGTGKARCAGVAPLPAGASVQHDPGRATVDGSDALSQSPGPAPQGGDRLIPSWLRLGRPAVSGGRLRPARQGALAGVGGARPRQGGTHASVVGQRGARGPGPPRLSLQPPAGPRSRPFSWWVGARAGDPRRGPPLPQSEKNRGHCVRF